MCLKERDFDQHVRYCKDEPEIEKLLQDDKIQEFAEVGVDLFIFFSDCIA